MQFDQMTIKLQEAFSSAQSLCSSESQQALECEHLLMSLFQDVDGIARALVKKVGVDPEEIISALWDKIAKLPKVSGAGQVYISETLSGVVRKAEEEARDMKDEFLSAEHILLAVS
ncbi:MAG: type VI secretion system ATPase TssH, partial [Nitrospinae bacterium]|nr:type VI secretion system ATPase TssH [Nitrospinota bacterium]